MNIDTRKKDNTVYAGKKFERLEQAISIIFRSDNFNEGRQMRADALFPSKEMK